MKPNFALKLSHDGLEILQRAASGWVLTGSTRFDTADLDGALRQLRQRAEGQAPDGLRSKLIMPASEVRYATVMAPGPTDEARRLQIEAEIEGLTPYALHELAYDYGVEGDHALVAICAREILAEAEEFAQTHGFNPVSFVAIPPSGVFIGEPFFGETSCARAFLAPTELVKRDSEPVRMASAPKPAAAAAAPPSRAAATERPAPPAAALATPAAPAAPAGRAGASVAAAAPEAFSRVGSLVRRMGTRIRREQAQAATEAPPKPAVAPQTPPATAARAPEASRTQTPKADAPKADATKADAPKASTPVPAAQTPARTQPATPAATPPATATSVSEKPASATQPASTAKAVPPPVGREPAPSGPARPVNGKAPEGKPADGKLAVAKPADGMPPKGPVTSRPDAEKAAQVAFASRRSTAAPTASRPAGPGPALVSSTAGARADKPNPGGRIAVLPATGERERPGAMTRLYRRGRRATQGALASIGLMKPAESRGRRRRKAEAAAQPQPLVPASRPPADEREKATEAQALTIFGARNMQSSESSFARRGLMLTGGLLLLLVAVAIWAVYFTNGTGRDTTVAQAPQQEITALPQIEPPASVAEPEPAPPAEIIAPAPVTPGTEPVTGEAETIAEVPVAEEAAPDTAATEPEPAQTTDPDVMLEELVQDALTQALPADLLGQTGEGAGSPAPPSPTESGVADSTDETALGGGDSPQIAPEGEAVPDQQLALPPMLERPELAEVLPVSPPAPPPFGTEFTLGEDGLVEATPEGALTPTGVMVYARPPAAVPPARPAGVAPAPAEPEPEAQAAPPEDSGANAVGAAVQAALEAAVGSPPEADAPDAGAPDAGAVVGDDTPRADPALAGIRPPPRSPNVAAQAQAAEEAAAPETTTEPAPAPTPDPAPEAADTDDDSAAVTPPPGGVSLEGLRPQRRPTDLVPPAETAAVEEAEPEIDDSAPEAVAVSLRPTARPSDMSARVQAALAAARSPAAAPAAAAPAPAQTAAAAPSIPTSASVAQQATQTRAINLRRVNLIGVFGTPNDRRALVRLSNGQVMRVQVGDRLDGGQVSAIGEDELRYVKNGRNEILRIGSSG